MKWLRYQRVISLKIQVGNTNQRNKWANTDPQTYRRWGGASISCWSITPALSPVLFVSFCTHFTYFRANKEFTNSFWPLMYVTHQEFSTVEIHRISSLSENSSNCSICLWFCLGLYQHASLFEIEHFFLREKQDPLSLYNFLILPTTDQPFQSMSKLLK
jgi:hypothetical protein